MDVQNKIIVKLGSCDHKGYAIVNGMSWFPSWIKGLVFSDGKYKAIETTQGYSAFVSGMTLEMENFGYGGTSDYVIQKCHYIGSDHSCIYECLDEYNSTYVFVMWKNGGGYYMTSYEVNESDKPVEKKGCCFIVRGSDTYMSNGERGIISTYGDGGVYDVLVSEKKFIEIDDPEYIVYDNKLYDCAHGLYAYDEEGDRSDPYVFIDEDIAETIERSGDILYFEQGYRWRQVKRYKDGSRPYCSTVTEDEEDD